MMLKIIERYITKNMIIATLLVSLVLGGVLFLMNLLGELKNVGEGDYTLTQAFFYVLLRLPGDLYQFSPLLILIGGITGLGVLSSQRELTVMRTAGFSTRQITMSTAIAACLMIAVITVVGEWMGPTLSAKATMQKGIAQNGGQAVVTSEGVWMHIKNNFINVRHIESKNLLVGVTRYEFDPQHVLLTASYAATLKRVGQTWQMQDGVMTSFYKDRTKSESFKTLPWHLSFNTSLLKLGQMNPNEQSLLKLAQFVGYLKENHLQSAEYRFNFWQRVLKPFASLIMIFLAIPFVLGVQNALTISVRTIMGILAGFVFFIFNAFLGQLAVVYQIPPFLAALLPLLVFAALSIFLAKRLITR